MPTISIDKCSGVQLYLSKDSLNVEIVASKSSEMNVNIPKGEDVVEQAMPEQYKTIIQNGKLFTTPVEHV